MLDYSKCAAVGDNVLIRYSTREMIDGIRIPPNCPEAKIFDVISVGDEVTRCNVGDRVMPMGVIGKDWGWAPGTHEFIIMRNECIALVLDKESMDTPPPKIEPQPEPEKYVPDGAKMHYEEKLQGPHS